MGGRQRGFTLLEAIVAMLLVATLGLAAFDWINSGLRSMLRIEDSEARTRATLNIVEYLESINPMAKPEGEANFGDYRFRWKAVPITEPRDGANYPQGISLYRLALYQTSVLVQRPDGAAWFDFSLKQVGYHKERQPKLPFS